MIVSKFPGREIEINGKALLYFGGTSYLAMATNQDFLQLITNGIQKWGTVYGSSRNANVRLGIYETAEDLIAEWIGAESAVTTSSGTLAGKMVIDYLSRSEHVFFHYPRTHPAILANNSLPLYVQGALHPRLQDDKEENIVITSDAMLSSEVTPTSFKFLESIPSCKLITLIVDESHSLGVVGENGQGVFSGIPSMNLRRKIMITSLSKALGLSGGFIASDQEFVNKIKEEASFISSSGANPAYLEAFINSQDLYSSQLVKLRNNMKFLFSQLSDSAKLNQNKNYPVLYYMKDGCYDSLLEKGIVITSFKYPSYSKPMNRIVITAEHTRSDLEVLASALNELT